ncbi:hypothetical protein CRG98_024198 [Punica granatum]|uniref:Uncharacterized protein n=1 Tax=Punica granatum TaxID=22663 RepID=A0A2I0JGP1_PUNGR|nr:hypothetical protein CRG98_024198 [Punica granatum]
MEMYSSRYGTVRKYCTCISEFSGAGHLFPQYERSKLDAKAKQCIFLGYAHEEFGYRFLDLDSRKIIKSRVVMLFEDQTSEDLQKLEKARVSSPYEISIPVPVDVKHRVEEAPAEYEETMTGGEISQVDDDVIKDDTGSQLQLEPIDNLLERFDRVRRPSIRDSPYEYVLLTNGGKPEYYDEAVAHEYKEHRLMAMNEKINSLSENHTYDLMKLPQGKRALKNKWVYRLKTENSRPQYKVRLVVKGFNQKKKIDFEEIFSPVVKMSSI